MESTNSEISKIQLLLEETMNLINYAESIEDASALLVNAKVRVSFNNQAIFIFWFRSGYIGQQMHYGIITLEKSISWNNSWNSSLLVNVFQNILVERRLFEHKIRMRCYIYFLKESVVASIIY